MPRRHSSRPLAAPALAPFLALAVCLSACGEGTPTDGPGPADQLASSDSDPGLGKAEGSSGNSSRDNIDEMFDELAAIGYADFSQSGQLNALGSGVVTMDAERSIPGFNLYTSIASSSAVLIDGAGTEVHRWQGACDRWTRAQLLEDGDLLVIGVCADDGPNVPYLKRYHWDGSLAWSTRINAHHDFDVLPDGRILVLTKSRRNRRDYGSSGSVRDNELTMVSPAGEVLESRSISDMIEAGPAPYAWRPAEQIPGYEPEATADYLHCNSVFWVESSPLAAKNDWFSGGNVLLSSRHQSTLLLVNWDRAELLWSFGDGQLARQHEASLLPSGNILLFDNGDETRPWSRIVQLNPATGQITWEYKADPPESFYSSGRGTVQTLRGGNLLVGNSANGEAFEITSEGQLVWRFFNPDVDENGAHGALRIERYPVGMVEAIIKAQQ
ncbi:MAG: hypothetical protein ACI9EF_003280 [Pseudohongiellaceae bacterium]|jgi:hypothetical protein